MAGIMSGLIGMLPALFLYLSMLGYYPEIMDATVPTVLMLSKLGMGWLNIVFQIVLFGTFIETGAGFIFAVTERVDEALVDNGKQPSKTIRVAITIALVLLGVFIAQFGLLSLIAQGYGTITWGFFFVYVIPILTLGVYKVQKRLRETGQK